MPTPVEQGSPWFFPALDVTENKGTSRPGLSPGQTYELAGVDGSVSGGLQPHPGFKLVRELLVTTAGGTDHDHRSVVVDLFPFTVGVGTQGYAYGFVYRATRKNTTSNSDVFVEWYNSVTGTWSGPTKILSNVDPDLHMTVTATRTLCYVGVKGHSPTRFYITAANSLQYTNTPGPGPRVVIGDRALDGGTYGNLDWKDDSRSGYAWTHVQEAWPSQYPASDFDVTNSTLWPNPYPGSSGSTSDSSSGSGCTYGYPFPEEKTTTEGQVWYDTRRAPALIYVPPGSSVAFQYQLANSATGLRSGVSNTFTYRNETTAGYYAYFGLELAYDSARWDQLYIYRSVATQPAGGTYTSAILQLEGVIDLATIWTCRNGTGKTFDPATTTFRHAIYYYALLDEILAGQPEFLEKRLFDEEMPYAGALFNYEGVLLASDIKNQPVSTSDQVSDKDYVRSVGELRWSAAWEVVPELFSPSSIFVPATPSNGIITFARVAGNVIGFSRDRQYHIRRETQYIRVEEMHENYGVTGPRALEAVGSNVYFLSPQGLRTVNSVGALDTVAALDYLVANVWHPVDLQDVSMAHDTQMGCLHILNPAESQIVCVWTDKARITEVLDVPFDQCARGDWPIDLDDYTSSLTKRAFFLHNKKTVADIHGASWKPRVYVVDSTHSKTVTGSSNAALDGYRRLTTLDFVGDSRVTVDNDIDTVDSTGITVRTGSLDDAKNLIGARVYVVESSRPTLLRKSATIIDVRAAFPGADLSVIYLSSGDRSNLDGIRELDRLAISPMRFRWVAAPVAAVSEDGFTFNTGFFRNRQIQSLSCWFSDVEGAAVSADDTSTDAKFNAIVFRGAVLEPEVGAVPYKKSGAQMRSVRDGESRNAANFRPLNSARSLDHGVTGTILAPGVEILCPDLDYRLLGVYLTGKILGSNREETAE